MTNRDALIDISLPLREGIPTWPNSKGIRLSKTLELTNGDESNVSFLECDVHTGTHIDAPRHFLENGKTVEQIPLDTLIGPTTVADLPNTDAISAQDLDDLKLPKTIERLLLKTKNSALWEQGGSAFHEDFVGLLPDGAQWIADRGIRLVGIDYLSIEPYRNDGFSTHHILLNKEVVILEGLNLSAAKPGEYELYCLPLRLVGAEGTPARAILQSA